MLFSSLTLLSHPQFLIKDNNPLILSKNVTFSHNGNLIFKAGYKYDRIQNVYCFSRAKNSRDGLRKAGTGHHSVA